MKHTQGYLSAQCKYFDIYFPYEHDITYMEDIENAHQTLIRSVGLQKKIKFGHDDI